MRDAALLCRRLARPPPADAQEHVSPPTLGECEHLHAAGLVDLELKLAVRMFTVELQLRAVRSYLRGERRRMRNRLIGYGTLLWSFCRQLRPVAPRKCIHLSKALTPQLPISLFHQCTHSKFLFFCFPCKLLSASARCPTTALKR